MSSCSRISRTGATRAGIFDRQALAFSGAYKLGEFLETDPGLQTVPPEDFYMVEMHGSTARVCTEAFLERTAREDAERIQEIVRLQLPMC